MLTKIVLKKAMKKVEKQGHWGKCSRKDFLEVLNLAHKKGVVDDKTTFDLTMRALKIKED